MFGFLAPIEIIGLELGSALLELGDVVFGRSQRLLLRQQVVARIARLDVDHFAHLAEFLDTLQQNDIHRTSSCPAAVT